MYVNTPAWSCGTSPGTDAVKSTTTSRSLSISGCSKLLPLPLSLLPLLPPSLLLRVLSRAVIGCGDNGGLAAVTIPGEPSSPAGLVG